MAAKRAPPTKKTAELQREIAKTGLMPLEVILKRMRWHARKADAAIRRKDYAEAERHMKEADEAASRAAPYLHPKLANIEMSGGKEPIKIEISERLAKL